jgi:Zn-dependent metalloprotease
MVRFLPAIAFSAMIGLACSALAADIRDLRFNANAQKSLVQRTLATSGVSVGTARAKTLESTVAQALALERRAALKLARIAGTPRSSTFFHFDQYYDGVRIHAVSSVVEVDRAGKVLLLRGRAAYRLELDLSYAVRITGQQAEAIAVAAAAGASPASELSAGVWKLLLGGTLAKPKHEKVVFLTAPGKAVWAYRVVSYAVAGNLAHEWVTFVDAETGRVLLRYDNLKTGTPANGGGAGGNGRTLTYTYNLPPVDPFVVDKNVGTGECGLSVPNVFRVNTVNITTGNHLFHFIYNCGIGNTNNATWLPINGAYAPENDLQYYGKHAFDLYSNWFGEPASNCPQHVNLTFVRGFPEANAVWMNCGIGALQGNGTYYPFSAVDTVGHELGHGVTEARSNLIYAGQSGALNEAFSDMAGEALEFYLAQPPHSPPPLGVIPRATPDFMVGADLLKNVNVSGLRDMCDPDSPQTTFPSFDHVEDYLANTDADVHSTSGIFNRAFCLIAKPPSAIDVRGAFSVFYNANDHHWTDSETFFSAAVSSVDAAFGEVFVPNDIGANKAKVAHVARSLQTVGALPDLYIRDHDSDQGNEPVDASTYNIWASPDLWNCASSDTCTAHENPEYRLTPNSNYLRVTIRNRGVVDAPAQYAYLHLYWTLGATGETWNTHWLQNGHSEQTGTNMFPPSNTKPAGAEITAVALYGNLQPFPVPIPAIPAGGSATVTVPWTPPNPADYPSSSLPVTEQDANGNPELCLLARIASLYDPMNDEQMGPIGPNVAKSNNIATRNTYLVDVVPGLKRITWTTFWLRNLDSNTRDLVLRLNSGGDQMREWDRSSKVLISLGASVDGRKWRGTGSGFKRRTDGTLVVGSLAAGASLTTIRLGPGEMQPISLGISAPAAKLPATPLRLKIEQWHEGDRTPVGAVVIDVRARGARAR